MHINFFYISIKNIFINFVSKENLSGYCLRDSHGKFFFKNKCKKISQNVHKCR